MTAMKTTIKVNRDLGPYIAGQLVTVDVDENGEPVDAYWRRRLQDAKKDGCCAIVTKQSQNKRKDSKERNDRGGNNE